MHSGRGQSFYEELRARDGDQDPEDRAGLLDEENLNQNFHDYDLDHAEGLGVDDSRVTLDAPTARQTRARQPRSDDARWPPPDDDVDNDVPASLLVEAHDRQHLAQRPSDRHHAGPVPGPSTGTSQAQWEATQRHQRLHRDDAFAAPRSSGAPNIFTPGLLSGNAKKKAEWRWANVSNLDNFIKDVYDYYQGHGIWCILLERSLHLA